MKSRGFPEDTKHRCEVFHCHRRKDRYCCFYCKWKWICKSPCRNDPAKCGLAFEQEEKT